MMGMRKTAWGPVHAKWAGVAWSVLMVAAQTAWAGSVRLDMDFPAQSLSRSLDALGAQSHVQMLYAPDQVDKLKAPALKGSYTAEEALRLLVKGSGLDVKVTGEDSFALVRSVADTASPVVSLGTISVVATRTENNGFDVPASVATVTRDQMDDTQAHDMAGVLRSVPGVAMSGGPRQAGQIPSIRGMSGPEIILTVDGARRDYWNGIFGPLVQDPDMIKQIDILRGSGSSNYGSGGIGGVMAFQTIDPNDVLKNGQSSGGWAKFGYRSGDNSYSGNLTGAAQAGGASALGSFTYRDIFDLHTGTGQRLVNDGDVLNGLIKGVYEPNDNHAIKLSYQRATDNVVSPQNPSGNSSNTNLQTTTRRLDEYNGSWAFKDDGSDLIDGKLTGYYSKTHIGTDPRSTSLNNYQFSTGTYGVGVQNTSKIASADWLSHRLTYGTDYTVDMITNTSNGQANSTTPDGRRKMTGLFLQDEMQIARDWTLTTAARWDSYDIPGASLSGADRLSPKASLKWQATPYLGVFGGYSEAFRAPTLDEMFSNLQTTRALFNFKPNTGLKPETSRSFEGGFTLAFDNVFASGDALRSKTTLFDEHVNNLISSTVVGTYTRAFPYNNFGLGPTGTISQSQNIATAHRWGGESELNYQIGDLDSSLGYSRVRVTDANTGANLFSPPDQTVLGLGYHVTPNWTARYVGQFVASQHYDSTLSRRRDAYALHSLNASYDRDWYRVDFGVTNLFDKAYVTYQQSQNAYYTYEEGRSYNLTLTARF